NLLQLGRLDVFTLAQDPDDQLDPAVLEVVRVLQLVIVKIMNRVLQLEGEGSNGELVLLPVESYYRSRGRLRSRFLFLGHSNSPLREKIFLSSSPARAWMTGGPRRSAAGSISESARSRSCCRGSAARSAD